MDLNLVTLQLTLPSEVLAKLTQLLGSALRFEAALRALVCNRHDRECTGCPQNGICTFTLLCGRQLSSDPELVRIYQRPGVPFVLGPPQQTESGQLELSLVLLGPAIHQVALFVQAVEQSLGAVGLHQVSVCDYQNLRRILPDLSSRSLADIPVLSAATVFDLATPRFASCRQILITITSPLRMMHQGRELNRFEPALFVKAVLRRISSLMAYYGTNADPDLFRRYAQSAERFRLLSQNVQQQGRRGVSGRFVLEGPCNELGPLLSLGGLLHLGKGAAYGNGAFTVSPVP